MVQSAEFRPPPIDEIVGLLEKHAPDKLKNLKQKYGPETDKLLVPGRVLGPSEAEIKLRMDVAAKGLETAIRLCKECLPKLQQKLNRVGNWQLVAQMLSVVGSASFLATLSQRISALTYILGLITLISSLSATVAKQMERTRDSNSKSLLDYYRDLLTSETEAELILQELQSYLHSEVRSERLETLITQTNDLAKKLKLGAGLCW